MNRGTRLLFTLGLLLVTTHRLPAPISEVTPSPVQSRPKSKPSSALKQKAPAEHEAGMTDQSVQVVLTPNTQAALTYLKNYVETASHMLFAMKTDVEPNEILERLRQALSSRYRSVSIGDGAGRGRSGLVMIFDLQARVGTISTQKNTVSFLATFRNGSRRVIETIAASGSSTVPYPAFRTRFPEAVAAAFTDFSQKLSRNAAGTTGKR